jgi:uncharacterized protein (DUF3084 family)
LQRQGLQEPADAPAGAFEETWTYGPVRRQITSIQHGVFPVTCESLR